MADVHAGERENGALSGKRKPAADADASSAAGLLKRARLEPPEVRVRAPVLRM